MIRVRAVRVPRPHTDGPESIVKNEDNFKWGFELAAQNGINSAIELDSI